MSLIPPLLQLCSPSSSPLVVEIPSNSPLQIYSVLLLILFILALPEVVLDLRFQLQRKRLWTNVGFIAKICLLIFCPGPIFHSNRSLLSSCSILTFPAATAGFAILKVREAVSVAQMSREKIVTDFVSSLAMTITYVLITLSWFEHPLILSLLPTLSICFLSSFLSSFLRIRVLIKGKNIGAPSGLRPYRIGIFVVIGLIFPTFFVAFVLLQAQVFAPNSEGEFGLVVASGLMSYLYRASSGLIVIITSSFIVRLYLYVRDPIRVDPSSDLARLIRGKTTILLIANLFQFTIIFITLFASSGAISIKNQVGIFGAFPAVSPSSLDPPFLHGL